MGKLLNVFYINTEGKELSVQYYCKDKERDGLRIEVNVGGHS